MGKTYRVVNKKDGVELLRVYPEGSGAETIKEEGGFDNHRLFNDSYIAFDDNELKIMHVSKEGTTPPNKEGEDAQND